MIIVGGDTVEQEDGTARNTGDGLRETFVHPRLEAASVEGIKIRIEGCVTLNRRVDKSASVWGRYSMEEDRNMELKSSVLLRELEETIDSRR